MSDRKSSTSPSLRRTLTSGLAMTPDAGRINDADSRATQLTVSCMSPTPSSPTHLTFPTHDGGDVCGRSDQLTPTVTLAERDPGGNGKPTQGTQGCKGTTTTTSTVWLPPETIYNITDPTGTVRLFTTATTGIEQAITQSSDTADSVETGESRAGLPADEFAKATPCVTVRVVKSVPQPPTTLNIHSVTSGAPGATHLPHLDGTWAKDADSGAAGGPRPLGF